MTTKSRDGSFGKVMTEQEFLDHCDYTVRSLDDPTSA